MDNIYHKLESYYFDIQKFLLFWSLSSQVLSPLKSSLRVEMVFEGF